MATRKPVLKDFHSWKNVLPLTFLFWAILMVDNPVFAQNQNELSATQENSGKEKRPDTLKEGKEHQKGKVTSEPGAVVELWFKSNGQLISYPPEWLLAGQTVSSKVILDANFWANRVTKVLNTWLSAIEAIKSNIPPDLPYTFGDGKFEEVKAEMIYKMNHFINTTSYIPTDQKNYYLSRIGALGTGQAPATGKDFTPPIEDLIVPEYTMEYFFYDKKGGRINSKGEPYCTGEDDIKKFNPCDQKSAVATYQTDAIAVPPGCYEVRYSLRLKNNTVSVMTAWTSNPNVVFPKNYADEIVKEIEQKLGAEFKKQLEIYNVELDKLHKDPLDRSIDLKKIYDFVTTGLSNVNSISARLKNTASTNEYRSWVSHWLWLTGGIPQMNPFGTNASIFPDQPAAKVSVQDKALYQLFESMVAKGALKISQLDKLDNEFKNIPRIKALIDAEASQQANEPMLQDRLLYDGIMKCSPDGEIYMRHLDALTNYVIMGVHPKKEITEEERIHILVENKNLALKLSIAFEVAAIANDDGQFTNELNKSNADRGIEEVEAITSTKNKDIKRRDSVEVIIPLFKELSEKAFALRQLPRAPTLPIYYDKDNSPDFITDILEHDYLFDAPANATYTVKVTNADNSEKEVAKGGYRINKLYQFRLKAGLIYSFLRKNDFTQVSPGHYTLDNPISGIDGTFGIQYFIHKQDIRSKYANPRWHIYAGLSMKKITENFYVGLGSEPITGLAIGLNAHIGKRERLAGSDNFPTSIKTSLGVHLAPSILIDPSLFVRIFTFANTNKPLIGF